MSCLEVIMFGVEKAKDIFEIAIQEYEDNRKEVRGRPLIGRLYAKNSSQATIDAIANLQKAKNINEKMELANAYIKAFPKNAFAIILSKKLKEQSLMECVREDYVTILGEDHNNKYARIALLKYLQNKPEVAKKLILFAEGIDEGLLTAENFNLEMQGFNVSEKEFFKKCLDVGIKVKGLESKRTSPFKSCLNKEEIIQVAKQLLPQEVCQKYLVPFVNMPNVSLDDFRLQALGRLLEHTKRKDFDEDAVKIVQQDKGGVYEVVICGYEHVESFKSLKRKNTILVSVGADGAGCNVDKMLPYDEKMSFDQYIKLNK